MPGIFVSYRRDDTAGQAGRLAEALEARYGRARVFIDIDAIPAGVDFEDRIHETLSSASVALILIGEKWLEPRAGGTRRIDEADDFVRKEIAAALSRADSTVIPVLIERKDMPVAAELPPEIAGLSRRNAFRLSNERWHYDVERLCKRIDQVTSTSALDRGWQRARRRAGLVGVGVGVAMLAAVIAAVILASSGSSASAAVRVDDIPITNPPARDRSLASGASIQVASSKPTIELKIHNLGTHASDVTEARITVADVLQVRPCFSAGGGPISATYRTLLPLTRGASIDQVINEQVKPDGFDFFQIVFDLPLSAYPGGLGSWFFRLHIQLLHDAQTTPVDAGYVMLSFSGAPDPRAYSYWWTKQVAANLGYAKLVQTWGKPSIDCAIRRTPSLQRFLAQPGRRSPELAAFASQLTTKF